MTTTEQAVDTSGLRTCLETFRDRFNQNERVQKLTKKWDRTVIIESSDSDDVCWFRIEDQELKTVATGFPENDDDDVVHCKGDLETLIDIFAGDYHPTTALLDGMWSVFSNERDKIKLESISFAVWDIPQTS